VNPNTPEPGEKRKGTMKKGEFQTARAMNNATDMADARAEAARLSAPEAFRILSEIYTAKSLSTQDMRVAADRNDEAARAMLAGLKVVSPLKGLVEEAMARLGVYKDITEPDGDDVADQVEFYEGTLELIKQMEKALK